MSRTYEPLPPCRAEMPRQPIATGLLPVLDAGIAWLMRKARRTPRAAVPRQTPDARGTFALDLAIRRRLFFVLVLATCAVGSAHFWTLLRIDGFSVLEVTLFAAFAMLLFWIAAAFWLALFGLVVRWRRTPVDGMSRAQRKAADAAPHTTRTALLMPIYNEDAERVFAGLGAMIESLRETGALCGFDIHVLSDTNRPALQTVELEQFHRFRLAASGDVRIYYRHRAENKGRKSGNIADFCCTWGRHYDYMTILDADSLMTGRTLVELVGLMNANPDTALIQVPPVLVGRDSLFARMQQFASSVYGPLVAAGLASLSGPDGNYWGHNAIIRVAPFMAHCGLPELPGRPPLGGEILSHDFVEAALLHRAGWKVWLAADLTGSFEESPPTMIDHLARDRRWCQGNLQHLKLLFARGFRLPSRLNFATGIMSYLSSPLWLAVLVLTGIEVHRLAGVPPVHYVGGYPVLSWSIANNGVIALLIAMTALMLFGPKLLAYLDLRRDPARLAVHGGSAKVLASIGLETVASALYAPIAMLSHTRFVIEILLGVSIGWSHQQRDDRSLAFADVVRAFAPHTGIAVVAGCIAWFAIPGDVVWLLPVLAGLVLAIPIVALTASAGAGRRARRWRLFLTPGETVGIPVLDRVTTLLGGDPAAGRASAGGVRRMRFETGPVFPAGAWAASETRSFAQNTVPAIESRDTRI